MTSENQILFSSYTKILITSWSDLHEAILEITHATILSDEQLQAAFNSPYQYFLKQILTVFSKIMHIRFWLTADKDDVFKERLNRSTFPETFKKISLEELNEKQNTLNTLFKKHYAQWQEKINAGDTALDQALLSAQWDEIQSSLGALSSHFI